MKHYFQTCILLVLVSCISLPIFAQLERGVISPRAQQILKERNIPMPNATDSEIRAWKAEQMLPDWEAPRDLQNISRAVPANNDCEDAIEVYCGQTVSGSTSMATTYPGANCSATQGVWYKLRGDGSTVTLSTCGMANYDTRISVYEGDCGNLVCIGDNDDNCGLQSRITFNTEAGKYYYIDVNAFCCGLNGDFSLSITCNAHCDVTDFSANGFCNSPNTYVMEVFIDGHDLPINGNQKFVLDGQEISPSFIFVASNFVYAIFDNLTIFGSDMDLFVQTDWGCTWTKRDYFSSPAGCGPAPPPARCDITGVAGYGAECSGPGTYNLCVDFYGHDLPQNGLLEKVVLSGDTYYDVPFWSVDPGVYRFCLYDREFRWRQRVDVFFAAVDGECTWTARDLFNEPDCRSSRLGREYERGLTLFPNPTQGEFTVIAQEVNAAKVTIVNQIGQTVYKSDVENGVEHQINLSDVKPGVYFIRLAGENYLETKKLVLTK